MAGDGERGPVHGRVIARDGTSALVRTGRGDHRLDDVGNVSPGDLVLIEPGGRGLRVVRAYQRGDYPTPATETARLAPRRAVLRQRAKGMRAIRAFFDGDGFLEIEAPLMVPSPGLEVHLRALPVGAGYLITSPEYQMKRLLAGGLERIYALCKCFRGEEHGHQHATEFTMLEWYRAWEGLESIRKDTESLVAAVATALNGAAWVTTPDGRRIDVTPPWPRMTVREAMLEYGKVLVRGDESTEELRATLLAAGYRVEGIRAWDDVFFTAFVETVEPALARLERPLFLEDWPVRLGALARRRAHDPDVVERFEAYIGGVELANAFGELTCPVEQRRRLEEDLAERRLRGLVEYPIDEKFMGALEEGVPPSAGIALGVDRLMMLATGQADIRNVLSFAQDEL